MSRFENDCSCDYYEDEDGQVYCSDKCAFCKRQKGRAFSRLQNAALAAEEARLRATGWYDEITAIRGFIMRIQRATDSQANINLFGEMFAALLGYEKFLAAEPAFRAVVASKLAEMRANPYSEPLKDVMDRLDALLAATGARGIVFLGDLLHSARSHAAAK